jgi:hypothetical protein
MYIGLWSRVDGFERAALTRALERRSVVQGTLMRATIHLVSARDYWPLAAGIRRGLRAWWLRVNRVDPDPEEAAAQVRRIRAFFADGPRRRSEVEELLGKEGARRFIWLDFVRVPPSGTWERRRADLYETAENWLGPENATPEEGVELLVRRYLGGFGPATRAQIADWAGLPVAAVASALERFELRCFRAEDGKELVDLPRAPLPDADTPAPVRFLPTWDATLLVHARRTGILPERFRPLIFNTKNPQSDRTFLVDGAVAGTWREDGGRVKLEPFEPLPLRVRRELEDEAARLERFLA